MLFFFYHKVVDEDIRPPQLLFEMAPKRSGFHWRVESLNASVWSALIRGRKRWGLYPPSQYFIPGLLKKSSLRNTAGEKVTEETRKFTCNLLCF